MLMPTLYLLILVRVREYITRVTLTWLYWLHCYIYYIAVTVASLALVLCIRNCIIVHSL